MSEEKRVYLVIDENGFNCECVDSAWSNKKDAIKRKEELNAYRVEPHLIDALKPQEE